MRCWLDGDPYGLCWWGQLEQMGVNQISFEIRDGFQFGARGEGEQDQAAIRIK